MFRNARVFLLLLSTGLLLAGSAALPSAGFAAALSCTPPAPPPTFAEDTPITDALIGCTDSDGPVTYALGSMPLNGTAAVNSDAGTYSYTPKANWYGTDSFSIVANQGGEEAIVTISLTFAAVNDHTSCEMLALTTEQGKAVTGRISCVDADDGGFAYKLDWPPQFGTVVIGMDGVITYAPKPDSRTADSFSIKVLEGNAGFTVGVDVTIVPVNEGGSGRDALIGGPTADTLSGYAGNDTLDGRGGSDVLLGGFGNDRLFGGDGSDRLNGGHGNDLLSGGNGSDTIIAHDARGAVDTVQCGAGRDTVIANQRDRVAADCEKVTRRT